MYFQTDLYFIPPGWTDQQQATEKENLGTGPTSKIQGPSKWLWAKIKVWVTFKSVQMIVLA